MGTSSPSSASPGDLATAAGFANTVKAGLDFLNNPPGCRVYKSTDFSHTSSGAYQAVTFNQERYDTDLMHSTVSLTTRITFNTAGRYDVGGGIAWAVSATGDRGLGIQLTPASAPGSPVFIVAADHVARGGGAATDLAVATVHAFAVGDFIELMAFQSSGGTLAITAAANFSPEFWAQWVGA